MLVGWGVIGSGTAEVRGIEMGTPSQLDKDSKFFATWSERRNRYFQYLAYVVIGIMLFGLIAVMMYWRP
jgi:hypothetical protein